MGEGRTYIVQTRRAGDGIEAFLVVRPATRVKGGSLAEIEEALRELVLTWFGDGEAAFEFVETDAPHDDDRSAWLVLSPNGVVDTLAPSDAELFDGGVCPACRSALGERTKTIRTIDARGLREHIAYVRSQSSLRYATAVDAFFLDALSTAERGSLATLPLTYSVRRRSPLFELVRSSPVRAAMVRERDPTGWRCASCGSVAYGYYENGRPVVFVSASQLLAERSEVVAIEDDARVVGLAVSKRRWRELVSKGVKCVSSQLVLVADNEIDPLGMTRLKLR